MSVRCVNLHFKRHEYARVVNSLFENTAVHNFIVWSSRSYPTKTAALSKQYIQVVKLPFSDIQYYSRENCLNEKKWFNNPRVIFFIFYSIISYPSSMSFGWVGLTWSSKQHWPSTSSVSTTVQSSSSPSVTATGHSLFCRAFPA